MENKEKKIVAAYIAFVLLIPVSIYWFKFLNGSLFYTDPLNYKFLDDNSAVVINGDSYNKLKDITIPYNKN
ncbi:MAG: hypothetical protein K6E14_13890, partial [Paludibacteraceae bacterium]|nr:hypothetical protein [Paludibacteraceae bacterium]